VQSHGLKGAAAAVAISAAVAMGLYGAALAVAVTRLRRVGGGLTESQEP
jgi:hypothetical protein